MPRVCSVCSDTKRAPQINAALEGGAIIRDVAKRFKIGHESVRRHARDHLKIPGRVPKVPAAAPAVQKPKAVAAPEVTVAEPISLRSADDVLGALEWSVAETKGLLQRAKAAGDLRLQNELLKTAIGALDKLAKSTGLYSDGTVVNVDASQKKLSIELGKFDKDELRGMLKTLASGQRPKELSGE